MRPDTARTITIGSIFVWFMGWAAVVSTIGNGSRFAQLRFLIIPPMVLAYLLPRVLSVKCPQCGARMKSTGALWGEPKELCGYKCKGCSEIRLRELAASISSTDPSTLINPHGVLNPPTPKRLARRAAISWLLFLATFPGGILAGMSMSANQDAAGRVVGIVLGVFGVGVVGGIVTAVFASQATVKFMPNVRGKLLACLPWVLLIGVWSSAMFLF